jgi:uncharacterized protein with GYD domain
MPNYVILVKLTDKGRVAIKDSPARTGRGKEIMEKLGGKPVTLYYTMGIYDIVGVVDFPSNEAFMQFVLAANSIGTAVITPLVAFKEEDAYALISRLGANGLV